MSVYLTEEEQIEQLKRAWKRYGSLITTTVSVILIAYMSWTWWSGHVAARQAQASGAYQALVKGVQAQDATAIAASADLLMTQHTSSNYAQLAAMQLAKQALNNSKPVKAKSHLEWVIDHATTPLFADLARLRLARLISDEKKYTAALSILDKIESKLFFPLLAELKGDIFAGQGNVVAAKENYQKALAAQTQAGYRRLVEMKRDNLG